MALIAIERSSIEARIGLKLGPILDSVTSEKSLKGVSKLKDLMIPLRVYLPKDKEKVVVILSVDLKHRHAEISPEKFSRKVDVKIIFSSNLTDEMILLY